MSGVNQVDKITGKRVGYWRWYDMDTRTFTEGNYTTNGTGEQIGLWKVSYDDDHQVKSIGNYTGGKKDGLWKTYYITEQLESEGYYTAESGGEKDGHWKKYHGNGNLSNEDWWKNGVRDGPSKIYHSNGKLGQETHYRQGIRNGVFRSYHFPSGKLESEGYYVNDEKVGLWKLYTLDKLVKYSFYLSVETYWVFNIQNFPK